MTAVAPPVAVADLAEVDPTAQYREDGLKGPGTARACHQPRRVEPVGDGVTAEVLVRVEVEEHGHERRF